MNNEKSLDNKEDINTASIVHLDSLHEPVLHTHTRILKRIKDYS